MRVHDSQAYRKIDVTRECISRILELREILLSFQTGFNLVNDAVVNTDHPRAKVLSTVARFSRAVNAMLPSVATAAFKHFSKTWQPSGDPW